MLIIFAAFPNYAWDHQHEAGCIVVRPLLVTVGFVVALLFLFLCCPFTMHANRDIR